jgi:hypothetical protein
LGVESGSEEEVKSFLTLHNDKSAGDIFKAEACRKNF